MLPDGRLRIAAAIDVDTTSAINLDVAVVGVLANGGLDPSFGGGDGVVAFPVGTANDTPTRMALDPVTGRIAVTGTTVASAKDDFFVALIEPAGTLAAFGTNGVRTYNRGGVAGASVSLNDRGTDVLFRPGGGILALLQVETDPDANLNGWQAVLHAFTDTGGDDARFSDDGDMVLGVGEPDTIPGGMTSYQDQLWVTGSTKTGQDTDAFLARSNADGSDLQSRRFDMRGNTVAPDQAVTSQGNDLAVVPGVPPTLVVGGFMTGDAGTDWAAAAFNDLTAGVGSFGIGDTVMATPGQGTIVGVAPGSGQWAAAGGSLLDLNSADTSFGTARLMIDADKECDLALEIVRPLEIGIAWGQPLPLTLRVTNVGTLACGGAIAVPAPYALTYGGATRRARDRQPGGGRLDHARRRAAELRRRARALGHDGVHAQRGGRREHRQQRPLGARVVRVLRPAAAVRGRAHDPGRGRAPLRGRGPQRRHVGAAGGCGSTWRAAAGCWRAATATRSLPAAAPPTRSPSARRAAPVWVSACASC